MTANSTIEILSYVKTTAETSSSNSYADKSGNFENVLKSANKTYSKPEEFSANKVADVNAEKKKVQDSINNRSSKIPSLSTRLVKIKLKQTMQMILIKQKIPKLKMKT